jgi:hypothetical protein
MLKANVGLSRKVSENYQSSGFSLNLEGEIQASLDDPQSVIERIKELYDLAEEALDQQIDRYRSDSALASRDQDQPEPERNGHHANGSTNGHSNGRQVTESNGSYAGRNGHQNGKPSANGEPATNKQIQFLQTLAKRQKLFGPKLEAFIEETLGRRCTPYDLTKKEAGTIIEALNPEEAGDNRPRR